MPIFVKFCLFKFILFFLLVLVYRVTDEALIAETAVWPNFFLMNIFFARKGSKLFIVIILLVEFIYLASDSYLSMHYLFSLFLLFTFLSQHFHNNE